MDEYETNYINMIKQEITQIQNGVIPEQDQAPVIKSIIQKLSLIKDPQIHKNIKNYVEKQNEIEKQRQMLEEQIYQNHTQEITNLKNMYEQVLIKL